MQVLSRDTSVRFTQQDGRVLLSGLADRARQREFVPVPYPTGGLWRVELRPPNGDEGQAVVLDASQHPPARIETPRGKQRVRILWRGLAVGSEPDALDVAVTISAVPRSSLTDWRIAVRSRSRRLGLWQVHFPRLQGLVVGKEGQAATPMGFGLVQADPVHDPHFGFSGTYPHCLYSMQFASLSEAGSCLYLATHDPHACVKQMRFERLPEGEGLSYEVIQLPEDMGVPGRSYTQPYPCVVGTLPGDWVDAAKAYRRWVLAESDWMRGKKPLAQRRDLPDWLKRLPYWVGFHGMTDEGMEKIESLLRAIGVPAGVHLYHWHQIAFDTRYPDFWPPFDQSFRYVRRLQELGARAMPYINCHLMDKLAESWQADQAWRYAAQLPGGGFSEEQWAAGDAAQLVAMCPATDYWQRKFDALVVQLVRDLGADGIYCDQVACVGPTLCFNPAHGHPLGGGNHWVKGHARQIANIRRAAATVKKDVFLTTESAAEPYDFDAFLRCNEGAPFLTPIWQMVYSGYRLSFGFYFYEPREWLVKLATQYLWGVQIGWAGQHAPEEMPEIFAFEREVARARAAGSDYLALGEMLRPPVLSGSSARVKTTWRNFASEIPIDWPAVQGSLWRAPDGSLGLALVNLDAAAQTVTFQVPRSAGRLGTGSVKLRAIYPAGLFPDRALSGSVLTQAITLPPHSAAMLSLSE